jgi:secreted PhoX family phosphatase
VEWQCKAPQLEHELVRQQQGLRGPHHGLLDVIQHLCAHWAVQVNSLVQDRTGQCSGVAVQAPQLEHELVRQQQGLRGPHHGMLYIVEHLCAHWAVQLTGTGPGTGQGRTGWCRPDS